MCLAIFRPDGGPGVDCRSGHGNAGFRNASITVAPSRPLMFGVLVDLCLRFAATTRLFSAVDRKRLPLVRCAGLTAGAPRARRYQAFLWSRVITPITKTVIDLTLMITGGSILQSWPAPTRFQVPIRKLVLVLVVYECVTILDNINISVK